MTVLLLYFLVFGPPQIAEAQAESDSAITVSWINPIGGSAIKLKNYVVTCNEIPVKSKDVGLLRAQIVGLSSNTRYNITVAAVGENDKKGAQAMTKEKTRK